MSPQQSSESEQPPESKYPEHEKLAAVKDKSQAIGEFVEWLQQEQAVVLCRYGDVYESREVYRSNIDPTFTTTEPLVAHLRPNYEPTGEYKDVKIGEEFKPVHKNINVWLAEFFEIDLDRLEAEKRLMLDEIRSAHHG